MRQGLSHGVRHESHGVVSLSHVVGQRNHVVNFARQHFIRIFATWRRELCNTATETLQYGASQRPTHDILHNGV